MDIPPEKEKALENVYGKGAKMLLKMGLQVEHLENAPLGSQAIQNGSRGRTGFGFFTENPNPFSKPSSPQPKPGSSRFRDKKTSKSKIFKPSNNHKGRNHRQTLPSETADEQEEQPPVPRNNELLEAFGNLDIATDVEENDLADDLSSVKDNIQWITDYCEEDIRKNEEKIRNSSKEYDILKKMESDICQRIESQQKFIEDLERLKCVISSGGDNTEDDDSEDDDKRLDDYFSVFRAIRENEFVWERLGFYKYIVPLVVPLMKEEIGPNWNPFKHPIKPAQLYVPWNNLLRDKPEEFEVILRETYMTPLKEKIRTWDGENPQLVIQIIKIWNPIFPSSLINEIKQEVWPKFNALVSSWDPSDQSDPNIVTPIWLNKWKKLFDSKFHVATQKICDKIEMTLCKWHPSENWAMEIFYEWECVFSDRHMHQIVRRVTAILENHLEKMKFDAENSDTEVVDAALQWTNFLSTKKVGQLLENAFYPNWLVFIDKWLKSDVDFSQVSNWYSFWKNRIPSEMWGFTATHDYFKKALDLIDCAVEAHKIVASTAALSLKDTPSETNTQKEILLDADKFLDINPETFKELLQKKCSDNGIIFFPLGKTNHDGKQMYRCKKDVIYLDARVIYIKRDVWLPISMNELLDI